jgi:hypothetical protein
MSLGGLIALLVVLLVLGLAFWLAVWGVRQLAIPQPARGIMLAVVALVGILVLLGLLGAFGGTPLIHLRLGSLIDAPVRLLARLL